MRMTSASQRKEPSRNALALKGADDALLHVLRLVRIHVGPQAADRAVQLGRALRKGAEVAQDLLSEPSPSLARRIDRHSLCRRSLHDPPRRLGGVTYFIDLQ